MDARALRIIKRVYPAFPIRQPSDFTVSYPILSDVIESAGARHRSKKKKVEESHDMVMCNPSQRKKFEKVNLHHELDIFQSSLWPAYSALFNWWTYLCDSSIAGSTSRIYPFGPIMDIFS